MIDEAYEKIVYDLLKSEWNTSNTTYSSAPTFQTGWYDYGGSEPIISITNPDTNVVSGGDTGITGVTGDGDAAQQIAGSVLVNTWVGTTEDTREANAGNPKNASFLMAQEVRRIMLDNATGTTTSSGGKQLLSLGPGSARLLTEDNEDPAVYRYEVTVLFTHVDTV